MARPSSAQPSSLRMRGGAPVPEEALQRAHQHSGQEGVTRPGSAVPSDLRHSTQGAPVPPEVLQHASQYIGEARTSCMFLHPT